MVFINVGILQNILCFFKFLFKTESSHFRFLGHSLHPLRETLQETWQDIW